MCVRTPLCMYVCMYVCIHVCIHYVCMHVYACLYVCTRVYACMYLWICVYSMYLGIRPFLRGQPEGIVSDLSLPEGYIRHIPEGYP